jgi:hypothetical protein
MVEIWRLYVNSNCGSYGIHTTNVHEYRSNMFKLKAYTFIWPDPIHVDTIGSKWQLYHHLDLISKSFKNTPRLPWEVLSVGDDIKQVAVLKRSHSDSGEHVLMPGDPRRNWEYMSNAMDVPGCKWIAQMYSPSLLAYGEWRVIILGGEIFHVTHTIYNKSKKTWSGQTTNSWYTIEELG